MRVTLRPAYQVPLIIIYELKNKPYRNWSSYNTTSICWCAGHWIQYRKKKEQPQINQLWDICDTIWHNIVRTLTRLWHNFEITLTYPWLKDSETTLTQLWHIFDKTLIQLWHNFDTTLTQLWHNFDTILGLLSDNVETIFIGLWDNFETTSGHCDYSVTIGWAYLYPVAVGSIWPFLSNVV